MKADLVFGMRFMPRVSQKEAYRQARAVLAGVDVVYTPQEQADNERQSLDQARRVLLGSILDQFGAR